jgi:hypothetical protein
VIEEAQAIITKQNQREWKMAMRKKATAGKKSKAGKLKMERVGNKKTAGVLRTLSKGRPPIRGGNPRSITANKPRPPINGGNPRSVAANKPRPPIGGGSPKNAATD